MDVTVSPGGRLVVEQAALQAAVQIADEAVGEGAQRLVVEVAGGAPPVVEVTAARARLQRAQRPLVGGVVEPPVARMKRAFTVRLPGRSGVSGEVPA